MFTACGTPLPTPLGRAPWVRFEPEVACNNLFQPFKVCSLSRALGDILRGNVANAAMADLGQNVLWSLGVHCVAV